MPPKKVKDETKNTIIDTESINHNLKLQSTPDVQVQNTKFDGIVLLSPAAQQLQKDLDSAIKDNISSTTKQKHGSINHLRMRELMEPDKGVDELEENLVDKLKASILVDVQGIREEIVRSFNSAAYDILQHVLGVHLPKVIQENETLKSMLGTLSAQVSNLQKEICDLKKTLQPSVFPEKPQLGQNPPFQNDFVINVKSQTSQPAPTQLFQGEVQRTDSTPQLAKLIQREWASPKNTQITKKNLHLTNEKWYTRKTFLLSRTHTIRKNPPIKFNNPPSLRGVGQLHLQTFLFPYQENSGMRRSSISYHILRYLVTYQILETPKQV